MLRIEGVAFARKPVQNDLVLPIDGAHDLAEQEGPATTTKTRKIKRTRSA
jgi:hypothetical protein